MAGEFQVEGTVAAALFTLKLHRGDGMCLLAMNWRVGQPPDDFVGFAIEVKEPGGAAYHPLKNRLAFPGADGALNPNALSTLVSPIQKFRWVHFPANADLAGPFAYRVTPVFMNAAGDLSYGVAQEAQVELARETWPNELNVGFTRGFVSSQAFVDRFQKDGPITKLMPSSADLGLSFQPSHPDAQAAYEWMGFEARKLILQLLDDAIADPTATVHAVAYDLNEPEVLDRLEKLGPRLRMVVDDSGTHKDSHSAETMAFNRLMTSTGGQAIRQHMGGLQHNKFIVASGAVKRAVCGSTNFSWRGFYVQNNNAITVSGDKAVELFEEAFQSYLAHSDDVKGFAAKPPATWRSLGLPNVDAEIAFSPHGAANAALAGIADDIANNTTSSLLYSLAFLFQTPGKMQEAIRSVSVRKDRFVYGISDKAVKSLEAALKGEDATGLDVEQPDGNISPVFPAQLSEGVPPPFSEEPSGGGGVRMHHKFVVIDFDKPTARVYMGSYNFSSAADTANGENLVVIRDRRVATSYAVEALSMFDHYHFRVAHAAANDAGKPLTLQRPPGKTGGKPWFAEDYEVDHLIRDRLLFA